MAMITVSSERVRDLEMKLLDREQLLRSAAALLMAVGCGVALTPSTYVIAANKIRDALEPRRGFAGPR